MCTLVLENLIMINKKSADPVCYCFYTVMSSKEKWCCISSCKSNVNTVKCFTFPKDAVRIKQWTESIGLKETPSYKSKFRVCEKHFSKEFFFPGPAGGTVKFAE